jgi:hypothetical protein
MKTLNRLLYPRTPAGRARYVKDSLNPKKHCNQIVCVIVGLIGIAGIVFSIIWCFRGNYQDSFVMSAVSLTIILVCMSRFIHIRPE